KILFKKGEFVSFEHNNRYVIGIVIKINIKTVSVKTEDGEVWRVSPSFLTKVIKTNS
ncbi:MAG: hypothetical protein GY817_03765, partial [bacterium]|nr:hypothetical protein [bacterium]